MKINKLSEEHKRKIGLANATKIFGGSDYGKR
jgi:hypothetical protein